MLEDELLSSEDEEDETSSSNMETWVQWYCSLPGHELYCEVDQNYIADNFNLFGIRNYIPAAEYSLAMDVIQDKRGML